ncbi:MAG: methyltransferase domain-containing protein [Pyrinomonadaceae bacterium]|nr:methyltransferase domain-containing protein [Pyrinomonadaceae bacterium]
MVRGASVARVAVEKITQLIGRLHAKQRIAAPVDKVVKVNLGCGMSVAPGWINIDGSLNAWVSTKPAWFHPLAYRLAGAKNFYPETFYCETLRDNEFVHHNLAYGVPLNDKSADFIYSSHFLEHLDRESGRRLLKECLRVLKPCGVLRIGVPDLGYAWEMYQSGDKEHMLHDYFFVEAEAGYSQHRYAYDYEMLSKTLIDIGFITVQRARFQQGDIPDLEILDNRGEYTLFVEARRPSDAPCESQETEVS